MTLTAQWLAPIRYGLPLAEALHGARDRFASLQGTLVGCAAGPAHGWMTAADLAGRPQWREAITAFARDVAADQCRAMQQAVAWPEAVAARWQTTVRETVPLALTADVHHVRSGQLATWLQATGCTTVKLKVDAMTDVRALHALVEPLRSDQPRLTIRLDCNQSWASLAAWDLRERLQACATLGVHSVEDPTPPAAWPTASPVPLAADLIDMDLPDFLALARGGGLALAVVKPSLLGSLQALGDLLATLAAWRVPVALSSLFDAPRGLAALAALAACSPGELAPCGLATQLGMPPRWQPRALQVDAGRWRVARLWPVDGRCAVPPDVSDRVAQAAVLNGDREAVRWVGEGPAQTWTWQQWHDDAERWAAWLVGHGVGRGDRVAAWRGNHPDTALLAVAVQRCGGVWAPIHPRATLAEWSQQVARLDPALVLAEAPVDSGAGQATKAMPWPHLPPAGVSGLPHDRPRVWGLALPPLDPHDTVAIVATSGTSGTPRLPCLSALSMAVAAAAHWQAHPPALDERWLACLPMCHVSGWMVLERAAAVGATMVLTDRTAATDLMPLLVAHAITTVSLVPTQLRDLIALGPPPPTLRLVLVGGAPLDPPLQQAAQQLGWPVVASYGMTETCAQAVAGRVGDVPATRGGAHRVGWPLAGLQVHVDDGGEIWLAGPQCMTAYWRDEPATAAAVVDGWLRTGDCGELDDQGALWVASRRADRILCGGENVDPAEIEGCLARLDGVVCAVAVGVDDPRWGEVVGVWLQVEAMDDGWRDRGQRAVQSLAVFKRPRRWLITRDPPPRGRLDKVLRAEVRQALSRDGF
jgi:O-succinylbenzoic acid--CoA ligase